MSELDFNALKEDFLNNGEYSDSTIKYMRFILFGKKTKELEDKYNKDLCMFNLHELKILLGSFLSISKNSVRKNRTIISKYIEYARYKNYIDVTNFTMDIKEEDLENLVYKIAAGTKYITKEELDMICEDVCINYQDRIMFRLPFEGVKGEASSELINLKVDDIDIKNNMIRITEGKVREIQVSPETIKDIQGAIIEEEYESYITNTGSKCKARKLYKTEYIFRKSSRVGKDKPNYQTIFQRFKKVRAEAGYPALTIETLWWSGIFDYARQIKNKNNDLTDSDYNEIVKRFGCSEDKSYRYVLMNAINENI